MNDEPVKVVVEQPSKESVKQQLSLAKKMHETAELLEKVPQHFGGSLKREEVRREFNTRLITIVTTAVGVVAALFWQTAITDTIKTFIPTSGAWYYEILVAFIVTVLAAVLLYYLSRQQAKPAK